MNTLSLLADRQSADVWEITKTRYRDQVRDELLLTRLNDADIFSDLSKIHCLRQLLYRVDPLKRSTIEICTSDLVTIDSYKLQYIPEVAKTTMNGMYQVLTRFPAGTGYKYVQDEIVLLRCQLLLYACGSF